MITWCIVWTLWVGGEPLQDYLAFTDCERGRLAVSDALGMNLRTQENNLRCKMREPVECVK